MKNLLAAIKKHWPFPLFDDETAAEQPMWVVFWTDNAGFDDYAGQEVHDDYWQMFDTKPKALEIYEHIKNDATTYCAGYAQIAAGTEPQWMDGGEA